MGTAKEVDLLWDGEGENREKMDGTFPLDFVEEVLRLGRTI